MRKILLLISMMKGGGAERVAALLLNEFRRRGCECEYMMTSCRTDEAVRRDLDEDIVFSSLQDNIPRKVFSDKLGSAFASAICKPAEALGRRAPLFAASLSFRAQYGREIELLRKKLISEPDTVCIAFLQPSIPILMLAAEGLPNKVIFSERADPHRLMRHRYGEAFIRRYYGRADAAVFQTKDAMQAYPPEIAKKASSSLTR